MIPDVMTIALWQFLESPKVPFLKIINTIWKPFYNMTLANSEERHIIWYVLYIYSHENELRRDVDNKGLT